MGARESRPGSNPSQNKAGFSSGFTMVSVAPMRLITCNNEEPESDAATGFDLKKWKLKESGNNIRMMKKQLLTKE
ncbi:hypothetical protein V6N13_059981 [Hibiscus sabdariffa]|uniref:Uncharacterized protein n=1 Tax=Hibiscus sabdariffa TaxID=183260 RepID=A0ABR2GBC1_9ROSI